MEPKLKCGACGAFETRCTECGAMFAHGHTGLCLYRDTHDGEGKLVCRGCGRPVNPENKKVTTFDGQREYSLQQQ